MSAICWRYAGGVVTRSFVVDPIGPRGGGRGRVRGFSGRSRSRMARYLRCCESEYVSMGTLTYPRDPGTWGGAKAHLRLLGERLRRRFAHDAARPWSFFWFLEFQSRGAPHFHFFATHFIPRDELARAWFEIVGSCDERHLRAGTRIERLRRGRAGTIKYAKKYAFKLEQKQLPDMYKNQGFGRWWGVRGHKKSTGAATRVTRALLSRPGITAAIAALDKSLQTAVSEGGARFFRREYADVWIVTERWREREISSRLQAVCEAVSTAVSDAAGSSSDSPPASFRPATRHEWYAGPWLMATRSRR
jgi:hypothetical protein